MGKYIQTFAQISYVRKSPLFVPRLYGQNALAPMAPHRTSLGAYPFPHLSLAPHLKTYPRLM